MLKTPAHASPKATKPAMIPALWRKPARNGGTQRWAMLDSPLLVAGGSPALLSGFLAGRRQNRASP
jgi:hypothetical protein